MARKQFSGGGEEDAQALIKAYNDSLIEYKEEIGAVSVGDLVQLFNGDRNALARSLAGLPATGKISGFSKTEQGKYRDQYKNIDRWSRYEAGDRGKQARNILKSKVTQEKAQKLYIKKAPPPGNVTASITGWIGYDNKFRYRSIEIPAIGRSVDTDRFNAAMAEGDTRAAYAALFDAYAPGLTVAQADSFELRYE